MANTVVGIFEYESDAQDAQNYLLANGFADGEVDIKTASYKSDTASVDEHDNDLIDRIGNFFKHLFDGDEEETKRYSEAGRRGTIVTVHATNAEEAESAAAILDQYGAVDVNESAANYSADREYTTPVSHVPVNPYPDNSVDPYANRSLDVVSNASTFPEDQTASNLLTNEELLGGERGNGIGGARLRSRIVGRPVEESIRLRQGQVSLNKTTEERDELLKDTLRNTEGNVEDLTYEERMRRAGLDL
jgi:hypothetical protein